MSELFDQAFWDERYRSRDALWSGRPNANLVAQSAELSPGSALDVGCGEGADAIWLAEQGWTVTALDTSAVALGRAAEHADRAGAGVAERITWLHTDLRTWTSEPDTYDLVSSQYMHLYPADRDVVFGRLAAAVKPGGSLLVVGHHPSDLQTTVPRPPITELFFTGPDIVALLDPAVWEVVTNSAVSRQTTDPHGDDVTIHDAVVRLHRRR